MSARSPLAGGAPLANGGGVTTGGIGGGGRMLQLGGGVPISQHSDGQQQQQQQHRHRVGTLSAPPPSHCAWAGLPGGGSLPFFRRVELRTSEGGFVWMNPMWLFQESCFFKAVTSLLIGGGMGIMMGIFFGAVGADTSPILGPGGREIPQAPLREQVRTAYRGTAEKSLFYMRSFAVMTALFTGSECLVEKARGKNDAMNGGISGCFTGAALGARSGPLAACGGCVGFGAFSMVIDSVMHSWGH